MILVDKQIKRIKKDIDPTYRRGLITVTLTPKLAKYFLNKDEIIIFAT